MTDIDAVVKFIKAVRQHFPTAKKTEDEERDWVKSMAYILRDYVASELAYAAEQIITKRETRGFPLPSECLKACAHARSMIRLRSTVVEHARIEPQKQLEPGYLIWRRRDQERREELRRKREKTR
jgi:hypothetical protein